MAFGAFRLAKPHPPAQKSAVKLPPRRHRRTRPTLSCLRCRQLKVRCDRKVPCDRCVWSQVASQCNYCAFPLQQPCGNGLTEVADHDQQKSAFVPATGQPEYETTTRRRPQRLHVSSTLIAKSTNFNENFEHATQIQNADGTQRKGLWTNPSSARRGRTHWLPMLHHVWTLQALKVPRADPSAVASLSSRSRIVLRSPGRASPRHGKCQPWSMQTSVTLPHLSFC